MEWIPLNIPRPEDGKKYDIRLTDGRVIANVEFWGFGGGFDPLEVGATPSGKSCNVRYPMSMVTEYRPAEP